MTDKETRPIRSSAEDDSALDDAFAAARASASDDDAMSAAFTARLLADIDASAPPAVLSDADAAGPSPSGRTGWLDRLRGSFGAFDVNWPTAAGLTACAVFGLWLGYAPPTGVESIVTDILNDTSLSGETELDAETFLLAFDLGGLDG